VSLVRYLALSINLCWFAAPPARAQSAPSDDGGLALPPNFHATIFADHLGHPRNLAAASNGVVYANTWSERYYHFDTIPEDGCLIAIRAADRNGPASEIVRFGPTAEDGNHGGTGVWVHDGYVYAETNDKIVRYKLPDNGIVPTGQAETIVSGLLLTGDHPMHPMSNDRAGDIFVDLGSATNECQSQNRVAGVTGIEPCTELETRGGNWRYDANKLNQTFSPAERFATGLRNSEAVSLDYRAPDREVNRPSTGFVAAEISSA
jgi:glucose/arabinose dehydrogenase